MQEKTRIMRKILFTDRSLCYNNIEVIWMQRSQILWVAQSYTLPQSGVKKHSHPYYHLFYIHSGEGIFALEEREQFLRAGDCLLVPPEMPHAYHNEATQPLEIGRASCRERV